MANRIAFTLGANSSPVTKELQFAPTTLSIDNPTLSYVYLPDIKQWVPPQTFGRVISWPRIVTPTWESDLAPNGSPDTSASPHAITLIFQDDPTIVPSSGMTIQVNSSNNPIGLPVPSATGYDATNPFKLTVVCNGAGNSPNYGPINLPPGTTAIEVDVMSTGTDPIHTTTSQILLANVADTVHGELLVSFLGNRTIIPWTYSATRSQVQIAFEHMFSGETFTVYLFALTDWQPSIVAIDSTYHNVAPLMVDSSGNLLVNVATGGGGGPVTIADGDDVAEGATTDVAVVGDVAGTVSAKLRGLSKILNDVWSSASHYLSVNVTNASIAVTGTFWQATQPVSGTVTANQGTSPWIVQDSAAETSLAEIALDTDNLAGSKTDLDAISAVEGTTTDVAVVGDNSGTVSAKLRGINKILNDVWSSASHYLSVNVANASIAVTGTFWQATQPVSGTVTVNQGTSPWVVSGGGGGAVTVADGADVAQGATTDVAVVGDNSGTVSAKLRGINKILNDVWSSASHYLSVNVANASIAVTGTFWQATQPVSIAAGSDVTEGNTTDAAVTTDANGTISAKLRGLVKLLNGVIGTDGSTAPTTGILIQGQYVTTGNAKDIQVDSTGHLSVILHNSDQTAGVYPIVSANTYVGGTIATGSNPVPVNSVDGSKSGTTTKVILFRNNVTNAVTQQVLAAGTQYLLGFQITVVSGAVTGQIILYDQPIINALWLGDIPANATTIFPFIEAHGLPVNGLGIKNNATGTLLIDIYAIYTT